MSGPHLRPGCTEADLQNLLMNQAKALAAKAKAMGYWLHLSGDYAALYRGSLPDLVEQSPVMETK